MQGWWAASARSLFIMRVPSVAARSARRFSRTKRKVAAPAAMASWLPRKVPAWAPGTPAVEFLAVDDDGQREAAADRLGQHHHVGHDAAVADRPERPGPADAGLHLVGDQRDAAGLR